MQLLNAETFSEYGLVVVIEDYIYKQDFVVESKGAGNSLARIFPSADKASTFSFAGVKFSISDVELKKLAVNAEVRYYDQKSVLGLATKQIGVS
jgi:hypothetical protein